MGLYTGGGGELIYGILRYLRLKDEELYLLWDVLNIGMWRFGDGIFGDTTLCFGGVWGRSPPEIVEKYLSPNQTSPKSPRLLNIANI